MPEYAAAAEAAWAAIGEALATQVVGSITVGNILTAAVVAGSAMDQRRRSRNAAADARRSYLNSFESRSVMLRSATAPRTYTYGYDQVSGPLADAFITGDKDQFLHLLVVVSARQVAAIPTVYFNESALPPEDADGFIRTGQWARTNTHADVYTALTTGTTITLPHAAQRVTSVTFSVGTVGEPQNNQAAPVLGYTFTAGSTVVGNVPSGMYVTVNYEWDELIPRVRIHKFLGAPGQTVPTALLDETGGRRTSAHRGDGLAWLWVRLEWDSQVFGQVGVPNISALVQGALVWDPRTSTTAWSDNAALCSADFARDQQLGLRCTAAQVPDSELIAEANISDELVIITAGGGTQRRYTANGTVGANDTRLANFDALLDAMAGGAVWTQGRWRIRAGASPTPEPLTLTGDFLTDATWSVQRGTSRREVVNAVSATYRDPFQLFAEVQAPPVTNAFYEGQDGGRRATKQVKLAMCNDSIRAQRLAKIILERARQATTLVLETSMRGYNLAPGQVVPVTLPHLGMYSKPFEVRRRELDVSTQRLKYVLRESDITVWAWNLGEATTADLSPDTSMPSPLVPPRVLTGLACASGTAHLQQLADGSIITRGYVTWDQSREAFVVAGGSIELQFKLDTDTDWQTAPPVQGADTAAYIGPLADQRVCLVRARPVNSVGRFGPWATISHTVVGKSAAPADVVGLSGTVANGRITWRWTANVEADYAETECRLGGTDWASATVPPIFRGAANTFTQTLTAAGTYTLRVKHRDSSRNESVNATSASVVVTAADLSGDAGATAATLEIKPELATIIISPQGTVESFAPAKAEIKVYAADGADATTLWTFAKTETTTVSTLTGTTPKVLQVSGFSPAKVLDYWDSVLIQCHFDGSAKDTSKYGNLPSVSTAAGSVVTYSGTEKVFGTHGAVFPGNGGGGGNGGYIQWGPNPSFRSNGAPWSMKIRVKFDDLSNISVPRAVFGNDVRQVMVYLDGSGRAYFVATWDSAVGVRSVNQQLAALPALGLQTNTWYALEFSYNSDGNLRFYINGQHANPSVTGVGTGVSDSLSTPAKQNGSTYMRIGATYLPMLYPDQHHFGAVDEFQYQVGTDMHTSAYTVETDAFPDGAYSAANYIDITATDAGGTQTLTGRFTLTTVVKAAQVITSRMSVNLITLKADETGVVTSYTGASAQAFVLQDGADVTSLWQLTAFCADSTVGFSVSGSVITITSVTPAFDNTTFTVYASRPGYATQTLSFSLRKFVNAVSQVMDVRFTPALITVPATLNGTVLDYSTAKTLVQIFRGTTDETSLWSILGTGTSVQGATLALDSGYVKVTAMSVDYTYATLVMTRSGYSDIIRTLPIQKVKTLPNVGLQSPNARNDNGPPTGPLNLVAVASGSVTMGIRITPDGVIETTTNGSSWSKYADWFWPNSSGIGASNEVRGYLEAGVLTAGSATMAAQNISTTRTWLMTASSFGLSTAQFTLIIGAPGNNSSYGNVINMRINLTANVTA